MTHHNKFTIDNIEYTWYGSRGLLFYSEERGVKAGDVRVINGMVFYACDVNKYSFFSKPDVSWAHIDGNNDNTKEIKKKMFNIEG